MQRGDEQDAPSDAKQRAADLSEVVMDEESDGQDDTDRTAQDR
jgi:hypothetical protein